MHLHRACVGAVRSDFSLLSAECLFCFVRAFHEILFWNFTYRWIPLLLVVLNTLSVSPITVAFPSFRRLFVFSLLIQWVQLALLPGWRVVWLTDVIHSSLTIETRSMMLKDVARRHQQEWRWLKCFVSISIHWGCLQVPGSKVTPKLFFPTVSWFF